MNIDWEDETIKGTVVVRDGKVVSSAFKGEGK